MGKHFSFNSLLILANLQKIVHQEVGMLQLLLVHRYDVALLGDVLSHHAYVSVQILHAGVHHLHLLLQIGQIEGEYLIHSTAKRLRTLLLQFSLLLLQIFLREGQPALQKLKTGQTGQRVPATNPVSHRIDAVCMLMTEM